MGKAYT